MLQGKNMGVKIRYPQLTFLSDVEIAQAVRNVGANRRPEKLRILSAQIRRAAIAEFFVSANLVELSEQRRNFAQIVDVCELPDQSRRYAEQLVRGQLVQDLQWSIEVITENGDFVDTVEPPEGNHPLKS
jgi:hypothetical protein